MMSKQQAQVTSQPAAPWALAIASQRRHGKLVPQAISHRGYKARYAENSMAAFRGAVRAGAQAIETDARLSSDGVAVLCHDASLERCFGVARRVADMAWPELAALRTTTPGNEGEPMARLRDLLAWLAADGGDGDGDGDDDEGTRRRAGSVWVLLDIKMDDGAEQLMAAIAAAIAAVPPGAVPWEQRLMLGCWNASTIVAARRALPAFALAHIGVSLSYADALAAPLPALALNLAHLALRVPLRGPAVLRRAAAARRPVFAWTVNSEPGMRWALGDAGAGIRAGLARRLRLPLPRRPRARRPPVDGVITDDPALFLDLCRRYEDELEADAPLPPAPSVAQALAAVVGFVAAQVLLRLVFLYRRFWLRKLDHLPRRSVCPGSKDD